MGKVGRPTKYDPDAMIPVMLEMSKEGASKAEICAAIDISHQTWYDWIEQHPRFSDAATRAEELSQGWWEKQGRKGIWSRDFNASAYSLQVRNRFPGQWNDKKETDVTSGGKPLPSAIAIELVRPDDEDEG